MAVTYQNPSNGAEGAWEIKKGLKARHVRVTIGATGDYSSGIALTAATLGFSNVIGISSGSMRTSGGTLRALLPLYDRVTQKIRLFIDGAGPSFTEVTPATHLAAGDVFECVIFGV